MKINSIGIGYYSKNNKNQRKVSYNPSFMVKPVDKSMARFYPKNLETMPVTVKNFLDSVSDKFKYTPIRAQQEAFRNLYYAKNIQDVRRFFPKEKLFFNLKDLGNVKADEGVLYIYNEFKELFENGILNNGEDLSVYLLKKIFLEIKPYEKISADLENDLHEDIKNELKHRPLSAKPKRRTIDSEYIIGHLGIKRPDVRYENSLRHTDEDYSALFSECVSKGQMKRWENYTPEQRAEEAAKCSLNFRDWWINKENFDSFLLRSDRHSAGYKRVRKSASDWNYISPKDKTELIKEMREGYEPFRYALYDAWNHSTELIKELSKFMKSAHQIFKFEDFYSDMTLNEIQSRAMTKFWASHRNLARDFGQKLSDAIRKVENAIKSEKFEELKKEIEFEREERIKALAKKKSVEIQNTVEIKPQNIIKTNYHEDFKNAYRGFIDRDMILPPSYIDESVNIILENLPQKTAENITKTLESSTEAPKDLINIFKTNIGRKNYEKLVRMQNALDAAISKELYYKSNNPVFFEMEHDSLIEAYREMMHKDLPKNKYPDIVRITGFYKDFNEDLSEKQIKNIVNRYFTFRTDNDEKKIADYIKSYGKSATIIFSEDKKYSNDIRMRFNEKFLKLMPKEIMDICVPVFSSSDKFAAEQAIEQIREKIKLKFDYMPKDFRNVYANEVTNTIHMYGNVLDESGNRLYSIKNFEENICKKRFFTDDDMGYFSNSYLKIPKVPIPKDNKIKLLAAEQAVLDELFNITGSESVFELELEEAMNIFEMLFKSKPEKIEILDNNQNVRFATITRPNIKNVARYYDDILEELKAKSEDIFDEDDIKNVEELVSILNSEPGNKTRDEYIRKRIKVYYDEPGWHSIESISEFKNNH